MIQITELSFASKYLLDIIVHTKRPVELSLNEREMHKLLTNKRLTEALNDSSSTARVQVQPWLRTRLFEAIVAYIGLINYMNDLAVHEGEKPVRDVKVNSFLAATHTASALNLLIYDTISKLKERGDIKISAKQLESLKGVLSPSKTYIIPELESEFDPILLEDLRLQVQRSILDKLDLNQSKRIGHVVRIPNDLKFLDTVGELDLNRLLDLSIRFRNLRISFQDGYVIWNFLSAPTMYIRDRKLFISPKQSKGFSKKDIDAQKRKILKFLEKERSASLCKICRTMGAIELAYSYDGEILPVCDRCASDPRIWRIIYTSSPKTPLSER